MLEVADIRYGIGGKDILNGISARFRPGRLSMIVGPNGSGKSTLLKIAGYEFPPASGQVLYGGRSRYGDGRQELARIRAVLSQNITIPFPLLVEEVVMMGRYPHFSLKPSANDRDIAARAMRTAGVEMLRGRNYLTLSGGERQMVQFARVLAQIWERPRDGTRYLLLDEPTAYLDINHQHQLLGALKAIAVEDVAVVTVIHDIGLAAQYADDIVALCNGCLVAEGTPEEVISPPVFFEMYGMHGRLIKGSDLDFPLIIFQDVREE